MATSLRFQHTLHRVAQAYAGKQLFIHKGWGPQHIISQVKSVPGTDILVQVAKDSWYVVNREEWQQGYAQIKCTASGLTKVTPEKIAVNHEFAQLCRQFQSSAHQVVYLDAVAGLTTMALRAAGFAPDQLQLINFDPHFWERVQPFVRQSCQWQNKSFFEFLRDDVEGADWRPPEQAFHVGYDVCCTFSGGETCVPLADLELLFARHLLPAQGGVLWCTFSYRGIPNDQQAQVPWRIERLAQQYGYRLVPRHMGRYAKVDYWMWVTDSRVTRRGRQA